MDVAWTITSVTAEIAQGWGLGITVWFAAYGVSVILRTFKMVAVGTDH
jgi:hypothetical protein